ncbi:helix-turn-helix transcriptional regulator [Actinokineospora sp. NBRC 105648]|uniref:helix-turn-helix domain-containing protein n=1 Tax=Actinokineospora sp. NBRC 105648 TaxID=3032206 RepID=UPI0024A458A3|nr:helix-turn-helix transcriptional regulator [Actinokineospora sp. NBRC 105648]GLZ39286.1 transcriptional regulator [Actinokineospora sp. NBRC 105648]
MSGERKPSQARDRTIGAQLKTIRLEQTRYTLEQAAEALQWSAATLSRTENGKRHITSEEVAMLLTLYQVPVGQRNELVEAARATGQAEGWWSRPLPGVLPDVGMLAGHESNARALTDWSLTVVPGLMQTYAYAVGLMVADGASTRDVEMRWIARLRRQQVLPSVDYEAYIHEGALRTPYGGVAALREQLRHLRDANQRGHGVRVVPEGVPHRALIHAWLLIEFPQASPVVYVELQRSNVFLYDREAAIYEDVRLALRQVALSGAESRSMIDQLVERL